MLPANTSSQVSVLIVDDSSVFRRVLGEIFAKNQHITIAGEAGSGHELIEIFDEIKADVILMDMEMPMMDGMLALHHIMEHGPVPVIMFSSLTSEGSVRAFDALKYGAVDFICKDFIFQRNDVSDYDSVVIKKIIRASRVTVRPIEKVYNQPGQAAADQETTGLLFCEDCGSQVLFDAASGEKYTLCNNCGDLIEIGLSGQDQNNFATIIGAGEGGYANLLQIIPQLPVDMKGIVVVVIYAPYDHVDTFAEYLDAITPMKVQRIRDGASLEGGSCYVASGEEYLFLKPFGTNYTIRSTRKTIPGHRPLDMAMNSVAAVFEDKVAGILLSGAEIDGEIGVGEIRKKGGRVMALNPNDCFCKSLVENIIKKCVVDEIIKINEAAEKIKKLHEEAGG
ncbi:MAG: hypothetical protein CSB24_06380 [Deltaproteobacteria bacterium]|nr:MAG: hypothetical protein CSB24_06380 [Deltaproteobacteria bacterium]